MLFFKLIAFMYHPLLRKITIHIVLMIFIFSLFPVSDLKMFSSCNVIQQIKKCGLICGADPVTSTETDLNEPYCHG